MQQNSISEFGSSSFVKPGAVGSLLLFWSMLIGWGCEETIKDKIKATESGDKETQYSLGRCYLSLSQRVAGAALDWLMIAANHGSPIAQRTMGECFEIGIGVPKDLTQAILWYERASEGGDSEATMHLGVIYSKVGPKKNPERAYACFRKAAETGNSEAQFRTGSCLLYGNGVQENPREAFNWFLKSSASKNSKAQFALGECYQYGNGTEQDQEKSFYWYRMAADQGDCEALFNIGVRYDYGIGTIEDRVKAFECYKQASERGHVESQYHLGFAYANGRGVVKNNIMAYVWLDVAAQEGFRTASEYLARVAELMSPDDIAEAKKLVLPLKDKLAAASITSP